MANKILDAIKEAIPLDLEETEFDTDILRCANNVLLDANQITDKIKVVNITTDTLVSELVDDSVIGAAYIITYLCMKTRLLFDPPTNTSLIEHYKKMLSETEFRMSIM